MFICAFITQSEGEKFEFLYTKYKNLLFSKTLAILGDTMLAEDAVSEAFLRIYKNMRKIGDPCSPQCAVFLVTIAKNAALTILKRQKKDIPVSFEEEHYDTFDLEEHVISEISSERIYSLLNNMSEELRSVFLFAYAYNFSRSEIARLLRISENNVSVRLHRARKKLSELLRKEGYGYDK